MENVLLSAQDIMARYRCSAPTARKLMKQMRHVELPKIMVWKFDLLDWEETRTIEPSKRKVGMTTRRGMKETDWIKKRG